MTREERMLQALFDLATMPLGKHLNVCAFTFDEDRIVNGRVPPTGVRVCGCEVVWESWRSTQALERKCYRCGSVPTRPPHEDMLVAAYLMGGPQAAADVARELFNRPGNAWRQL